MRISFVTPILTLIFVSNNLIEKLFMLTLCGGGGDGRSLLMAREWKRVT